MKLGIAGKGGVGKSVIASMMARLWARDGCEVVAIDCDSDPNLAMSAGMTPEQAEQIPPLLDQCGQQRQLASGHDPGRLLEEFAVVGPDGVRFLLGARAEKAGSG